MFAPMISEEEFLSVPFLAGDKFIKFCSEQKWITSDAAEEALTQWKKKHLELEKAALPSTRYKHREDYSRPHYSIRGPGF